MAPQAKAAARAHAMPRYRLAACLLAVLLSPASAVAGGTYTTKISTISYVPGLREGAPYAAYMIYPVTAQEAGYDALMGQDVAALASAAAAGNGGDGLPHNDAHGTTQTQSGQAGASRISSVLADAMLRGAATARQLRGSTPGVAAPREGDGKVYAPEGKQFPLLSFAHGTFSGGTRLITDYVKLLQTVASYGFIIIAPESCPSKECFSGYSADQLAALAACASTPSLHPACAMVDGSTGTGVFGHSMGAMATVKSAERSAASGHNIKAAVPLHPCYDVWMAPAEVSVPIMFTTGSADTICSP